MVDSAGRPRPRRTRSTQWTGGGGGGGTHTAHTVSPHSEREWDTKIKSYKWGRFATYSPSKNYMNIVFRNRDENANGKLGFLVHGYTPRLV